MDKDFTNILFSEKEIEKMRMAPGREIARRHARIKKAKALGIDLSLLDGDDYEDIDELQANLLILQDQEIPEDLRKRLLEKYEKRIQEKFHENS